MSLYIRDPEVDALAEKLQRLTQTRTKTDAVRAALIEAIARAGADRSFAERNADVLAMADALGPSDLTFASKPFFDDMWGQ
jgi:antitoxin VapB